MTSSTKPGLVEHVKFVMAGAQLEYMANLRSNANNGRFKVGETYTFQHESDMVARAAIIATLQYARDNVSNEMIAAGWGQLKRAHLPKLGPGPGAAEAFRAMINTLLQEIGGGKT